MHTGEVRARKMTKDSSTRRPLAFVLVLRDYYQPHSQCDHLCDHLFLSYALDNLFIERTKPGQNKPQRYSLTPARLGTATAFTPPCQTETTAEKQV